MVDDRCPGTAGRDEGPGEKLGSCTGWLALLRVGTGCMDLRAQFLSSRSHSLLLYCYYYYYYCLDKKSPHAVEVKAGSPFLSVPRDPRVELSFLNRHRQLRLHLVAELRVFDLPSFQDSSCPVSQQQLPPTEAWRARGPSSLLLRVSLLVNIHISKWLIVYGAGGVSQPQSVSRGQKENENSSLTSVLGGGHTPRSQARELGAIL